MESISADEFAQRYNHGNIHVMDVRKPGEFEAEHVENAESIPLDYISEQMDRVDPDKTYHVHCAGGYRSVIAASILKSRGFHNIVDVAGGYKDIKATEVPVTNFVCPTTQK